MSETLTPKQLASLRSRTEKLLADYDAAVHNHGTRARTGVSFSQMNDAAPDLARAVLQLLDDMDAAHEAGKVAERVESYSGLVENEKDHARAALRSRKEAIGLCAQVCSSLIDEVRSRRLSKARSVDYYEGEAMGAARCMSGIRALATTKETG